MRTSLCCPIRLQQFGLDQDKIPDDLTTFEERIGPAALSSGNSPLMTGRILPSWSNRKRTAQSCRNGFRLKGKDADAP